MKKRVTMQDIADELGVTKVSVSKAINGQMGISDELRQKALDTARRMGYVLNTKIPEMPTYTFGFIVTKRFFLETDRFYNIIYYHLNKTCVALGHSLSLIILSEHEENSGVPLDSICNEPLDGVFLVGQIKNSFLDRFMSQESLPMVALDFYNDHLGVDFVLADNYQLGYQAAMQMIASGHQHIGFVGDLHATTSICDRYFGYIKALTVHDLPIRPEWWLINNDSSTGEYTVDIELPEELPTGFVCHCDMAAYYLKHTLEKRGQRVPEDISLVAFDNTEIGRTTMKNLTTFNVGRREIADTALKLMLKRVVGDVSSIGKHYVQSYLIPGESIRRIEP